MDVLHLCLDVMSVINSSLLPSSRPLPDEMIKYAREDTHYLLYIYDRMRNELIRRSNIGTDNLLNTVIERSTEICLVIPVLVLCTLCVYDTGIGIATWNM